MLLKGDTMKTLVIALIAFMLGCAVGPKGDKGLPGDQGTKGERGEVGPPGQDGAAPIITVKNATAEQCGAGGTLVILNGTVLYTACNGADGTNGAPGPSSFTLIKLCRETPSYPSTFPEYAIRIDNEVYGVYSANGGFLALLPPGQYSSAGINSSCTLTINADGSITN